MFKFYFMISLNDMQVVQKYLKVFKYCMQFTTCLTAGCISAPSERPAEAPLAPKNKTGVIMRQIIITWQNLHKLQESEKQVDGKMLY